MCVKRERTAGLRAYAKEQGSLGSQNSCSFWGGNKKQGLLSQAGSALLSSMGDAGPLLLWLNPALPISLGPASAYLWAVSSLVRAWLGANGSVCMCTWHF